MATTWVYQYNMWRTVKLNYSTQTQNNYNLVNNFLKWKGNGDAYYMCIK